MSLLAYFADHVPARAVWGHPSFECGRVRQYDPENRAEDE